jgi:DNA recombination protein RmuC
MTIPFLLGLLIGIAVGGVAVFFLSRKSTVDVEQILQLAESKLSGKKEVIDGTLKDMKADLNRVETIMREIGNGNTKIDTRLESAAKVIKDLTSQTERLSDTTGSLKSALAGNSSRGQWGERMAEDVLRLSGLIEGINYIKQKKLEAGSKPDFTFILPQDLKLNMDVKFPFNNYQLYMEAENERDRDEYKKKFLKDVKQRVKEIQTRDYINPEDKTVDYVLLFVPNEQIFGFINEMDRTLIDEAMQGKTIICSPLSLYAVLAVIRQSIDSFALEGKSKEMLSLMGGFKQQWDKFKEQMGKVHAQFETVHKGYEELVGTRERQLDKQLGKLDEIRSERGIETAIIDDVFESVSRKQIAATAREEKVSK